MKLSQFKSVITNVESVEKLYYEYWIGLKLWKRSISVLCLFVNMKLLQNHTSWISTDLIQNVKIQIISKSVLNRYFLRIFISISNWILLISNHILSVSCLDFSISTMPELDRFRTTKFFINFKLVSLLTVLEALILGPYSQHFISFVT